MKPLIGITTGESENKLGWGPTQYGQNHKYSDAVLGAGGIPVLIPFIDNKADLRALYERLDGIVFAGGDDISPLEYGEEPGPVLDDISPARDAVELQLMKWAVADDKPLLGICRGFQVFNVALGGSLVQDIPSTVEGARDHNSSKRKRDRSFVAHQLRLAPDSRLASFIGSQPIGANTLHHQTLKKLAPGLVATAWAEDNLIEAVELPRSRFAIGVQCHPESLVQNNPRWASLLRGFVEAATTGYLPAANARKSSSTDVLAEALEAL